MTDQEKTTKKAAKPELKAYYLPEYGVSVKAESIEQAIAKIKNSKKGEK